MSDAGATIIGAAFGTSTTTTYIESAAGVEEGGKTGLTAVTVGVLMLSGLLLAGLFKQIPTFAAAPALVIIGAMMMRQAADIDWSDTGKSIPAFVTMVMMPFTYSIAAGIAWGIITYVLIVPGHHTGPRRTWFGFFHYRPVRRGPQSIGLATGCCRWPRGTRLHLRAHSCRSTRLRLRPSQEARQTTCAF